MKKLFIIITLFLSIFIFINSKCEDDSPKIYYPESITSEYKIGKISFYIYDIYVLEEKETGVKIYFAGDTDHALAITGGK